MREVHGTEDTRAVLRGLQALGEVRAPAEIIPAVLERVNLADAYFSMELPVGRIYLAYNAQGVAAVLAAADGAAFEEAFRARFGRSARAVEPPEGLVRDIQAQLAGQRPRHLRFDLRGLSDFERAVLGKTLDIPRGEVRPYAWIAAEIGHPQAVRAVGTALAHNPVPLLIPCHRVVRSDGRIGNYLLGSAAKRSLLEAEGAQPEQLERLAGAGVRYYGSDTTGIFCYPTCQHARRITDRHRVAFKSGAEAVAAGYRPCKVCRPAQAA